VAVNQLLQSCHNQVFLFLSLNTYYIGSVVSSLTMKAMLATLLLLPLGALGAEWCTIVNSNSKVNCRAGPSLSSRVVRQLTPGKDYYFTCYKRGDCYNDNW
jgi:uncharacterized protein YraI